ncbi:MAG: histidine triad nucleotide-binding protein [Alphaproteobacteria bacterium]
MTYDKDNIFAKILRGEIPCKKVYEDGFALAFHDIAPAAPTHVLVVPKGEYVSFHDFAIGAPAEQVQGFFAAVQKTAQELGLKESGYRIITNHERDAGQEVYHFHVHILGGKRLGKLVAAA